MTAASGTQAGHLAIIGIGPGSENFLTPQALDAISRARYFYGYKPYLERLTLRPGQTIRASDNRQELARAREALELAAGGENVAMISGGDPGIFAMAAAVCEAIDHGPAPWRDLDMEVIPGISAMLAVAARIGAPLGHDFCTISLSDNLKPITIINERLAACARAGLVLALYNPVSKARPWQLDRALKLLREILPPQTVVIFGRAVGRDDEHINVVELQDARGTMADMATCVIVGSVQTRLIERGERPPLVYSPRSWTVADAAGEPDKAGEDRT